MKTIMIIILCLIGLFMTGCASVPPTPKVQYAMSYQAKLANGIEAQQTKGGISINLTPVDIGTELTKSLYIHQIPYDYEPTFKFEGQTYQKQRTLVMNFFEGMTPFDVTIVNNTDHILRMKDARIVYINPNSDDPISPYNPLSSTDINNASVVINPLITEMPVYKAAVDAIMAFNPSSYLHETYIYKAVLEMMNGQKYINSLDREILPGMKYTGRLIIPKPPQSIAAGTLSFIDVVSETDSAGNPTARARFDYKVDHVVGYWKLDPAVSPTWAAITAEEYKAGMTPAIETN